MSWFKKLKKQSVSGAAGDGQPKLQNLNNFQQNSNVDTNICYDVFKSHWLQVKARSLLKTLLKLFFKPEL